MPQLFDQDHLKSSLLQQQVYAPSPTEASVKLAGKADVEHIFLAFQMFTRELII